MCGGLFNGALIARLQFNVPKLMFLAPGKYDHITIELA